MNIKVHSIVLAGKHLDYYVITVIYLQTHFNTVCCLCLRTQHIYNILFITKILGLRPGYFEQIVDYGGGTGMYQPYCLKTCKLQRSALIHHDCVRRHRSNIPPIRISR